MQSDSATIERLVGGAGIRIREIESPEAGAGADDGGGQNGTGASAGKNARLLDSLDRLANANANELAAAFSRGNNPDAPVGRLRRDVRYDRKGLH